MTRPPAVAPRLVSWLLLVFGVAEVPWVIYLAFNQDPTVEAFHVRLVTLGLGLGVAITAVGAAWTVWRGSRLAATWCVATAPAMRIAALVLAFVGLITLVRTGLHLTDLSTTADAERLRAVFPIGDPPAAPVGGPAEAARVA